jgi:hypothetical protein
VEPHPDFARSDLPREADLGAIRLTPLAPEVAEEDFEVVTASADVLRGVFGDDWPLGLTLDENRIDMGWHAREFTARRSFAWVVRAPDWTYLGCAYLYPEIGRRGAARIVTWVRDMPDRDVVARTVNAAFAEWIAAYLPATVDVTWIVSPAGSATGRGG